MADQSGHGDPEYLSEISETRHARCVLVVDPSRFARTCTSAGLAQIEDMEVLSCDSLAHHPASAAPPNLLLLQGPSNDAEMHWLAEQFTIAAMRWPHAIVMVITADSERTAPACLREGVRAVLPRHAPSAVVVAAIRAATAGLAVYPADVLMPDDFAAADGRRPRSFAADRLSSFGVERLGGLTARQAEVVKLLIKGMSNKAIARRLQISESTVKVHIRAIMERFDAANRTQIVTHFIQAFGDGQ